MDVLQQMTDQSNHIHQSPRQKLTLPMVCKFIGFGKILITLQYIGTTFLEITAFYEHHINTEERNVPKVVECQERVKF